MVVSGLPSSLPLVPPCCDSPSPNGDGITSIHELISSSSVRIYKTSNKLFQFHVYAFFSFNFQFYVLLTQPFHFYHQKNVDCQTCHNFISFQFFPTYHNFVWITIAILSFKFSLIKLLFLLGCMLLMLQALSSFHCLWMAVL